MASPINFIQAGFSGGMNLLLEPSRIAENEYVLARNIRNRGDTLAPVKNHAILPTPTIGGGEAGLLQGLVSFGDWIILFRDGLAYCTTYDTFVWTQITGFDMANAADIIYTCAVPVSTNNFKRSAASATDIKEADIAASTTVEGTIAGLVCQDGSSQPWIIYESGGVPVARELDTYAEWDNADPLAREYVPIGTKMAYMDGILYVVNSTETRIYRSVTGRPLDFVVNIETTGNKGGDADTTAYAVSNAQITCIQPLSTGSLFIATADQNCYAIVPNREATIFGEPTFNRVYLFKASCLNQFSFVDILGDFGFIDSEGLRSFNAVLQQQNEGRNSIFSQKIAAAFGGISQSASNCAAVVWDNYAIFSVLTKYGRVLVVYDTLFRTFVSFDTAIHGGVKQFAVVDNNGVKKLLGITETNNLFECYGGTGYAMATVKTREWTTNDPSVELSTEHLRAVFITNRTEGDATSTIYIDGSGRPANHLGTSKRLIPAGNSGLLYVVTYPATWSTDRRMVNLIFNHNGGKGFKVGYNLRWGNGAILTHLMSNNTSVMPKQSQSSKVSQYAS